MATVDSEPHAGVKVGSAEVLSVTAVVDLCFNGELAVQGYRLKGGRRVSSLQEMLCHNVLVVKGLDKNVILLSVRVL